MKYANLNKLSALVMRDNFEGKFQRQSILKELRRTQGMTTERRCFMSIGRQQQRTFFLASPEWIHEGKGPAFEFFLFHSNTRT